MIYFTRWQLLEWSIVPIGSNKDALVRNAQTVDEMRAALENKNEVEIPVTENENNERTWNEAQILINKNRL